MSKPLGYYTNYTPGDSRKAKVVGGSDLCRLALWQWVFTRIEPHRSRLKNEIGQQLGQQLDTEKAAGRPVKLVRNRVAGKAARLLFRELVKVCPVDAIASLVDS